MYIIAGLGNPGRKYELTRHNAGFLTVDRLAEKHGIRVSKIKFKSLIGDGIISGQKVLLVKPQTFMNLSGEALREVMDYYNEDTANLMVIYDDLDIPLGGIRIRKKGSAGTHNGMKSVIYQLRKDDFPRIRIGIGNDGGPELINFVIGKFSDDEIPVVRETVDSVVSAIECFLSEGIDTAMNRYNRRTAPGREND